MSLISEKKMDNEDISYIYLMLLKNKDMFKIGKANDIIHRQNTLKSIWGDFDLDNSTKIECTKGNAFKIEKILHGIFVNYNVKNLEEESGYTEWFSKDCYEDAV